MNLYYGFLRFKPIFKRICMALNRWWSKAEAIEIVVIFYAAWNLIPCCSISYSTMEWSLVIPTWVLILYLSSIKFNSITILQLIVLLNLAWVRIKAWLSAYNRAKYLKTSSSGDLEYWWSIVFFKLPHRNLSYHMHHMFYAVPEMNHKLRSVAWS